MECTNSKKTKKYEARTGAPFKKEDAQAIGETIEEIKEANKGEISPIDLVNEAKNKNSVLHQYFEWDAKIAHQEYLLQQARNIINHIVDIVIISKVETPQRSFISVTTQKGESAYISRETAIKVESYRTQILNQLITLQENILETMKLFRDYK